MRTTSAAVAVLLAMVSGCAQQGGTDPGSPDPSDAFAETAVGVAEAWRAAPASAAWRTGYVPLQSPTVLPRHAGFADSTKQAFLAGWYRNEIPLSMTKPATGAIRFPDGTLSVPLVSAAEAYAQLDQGDPPACPDQPARPSPAPTPTGPDTATSTTVGSCVSLKVIAANLGTVTVRTSRGEAQVPAWLFTIDELSGPVARVAVAESAVAPVPSAVIPEPGASPPGLVLAQDIVEVDGARLTYRLGVGACDTQITPLVAEYRDVVVVAGRVVRSPGICTEQLLLTPVTVRLDAPLAARPVLSTAGAPLLFGAS
jgi:hypothetical protein